MVHLHALHFLDPFPTSIVVAQAGGEFDPGAEWVRLGVAGLLALYLFFDNQRLRKDLTAERANTLNAETKHIAAIEAAGVERDRLRVDMLTRYEALIALEQAGQRVQGESTEVLKQAMSLMNQLASRPTLDPRLAEQLIRALEDRRDDRR